MVEIFCLKDKADSALFDYLAALDRRTPVDTLVVDAGRVEPATPVVDAIGESMRRRGRGEIVLVDGLAGRPAAGDPRALLRSARAFKAYAAALRRRWRADGVSVAVVAPGSLAIRAAALLRDPQLAMFGADRIAELIVHDRGRRRAVVAIPGAATVAMRALRLVPSRIRDAAGSMLLPSAGSIGEPADEGPLPGETGPGD
jgi:short-subunit dehydrogenase